MTKRKRTKGQTVFSGVRVTRSLVLYVCLLSLFVLLYFFVWPLCCLFFFDIQIGRTDNTMTKRKRTKGQTPIYKTLHIKLKIEWHRGTASDYPLWYLIFTASDYPFGILDLQLLITPFGIFNLVLTAYNWSKTCDMFYSSTINWNIVESGFSYLTLPYFWHMCIE
jgi:hypothetical protein